MIKTRINRFLVVVLIGCMGVGKTTLAHLLVTKLNFKYLNADQIFHNLKSKFIGTKLSSYYLNYSREQTLTLLMNDQSFFKLVKKQIWSPVNKYIVTQIQSNINAHWVVETFDLSLFNQFSGYCFWLVNYNMIRLQKRIQARYPNLVTTQVQSIVNWQTQILSHQLTQLRSGAVQLIELNTTNQTSEEVFNQFKTALF